MSRKKLIELGVLAALAVVLGLYVRERVGIRMGGTPSALRSEFTSEEDWILDGILRDIGHAAAYSRGAPVDSVEITVEPTSHGALALPSAGVEISLGEALEVRRTLELERSFWNPENYVEIAQALFEGRRFTAEERESPLLERLLEPLPATLAEESARVSERLASDILDASAHEEAALLLGTFGLREAAYGFEDLRVVLGRMTAHLAIARALRNGSPASASGRLAEAALLALSGRQLELLEALETFADEPPSGPAASFRTALYMYSVEDWRPRVARESLLVDLQRFRALVASLGAGTAIERMWQRMRGDLADWGRILTWMEPRNVAARSVIESQLGRELAELQEVSRLYRARPAGPEDFVDALNQRPGRLVGPDGPQVLDWGLWAAFFQRHICAIITAADEHLRDALGMPLQAEIFGRRADTMLDDLELNPIVQVRRTRYVGARVEDTVGMDEAISLAERRPELVTVSSWAFLEDTARHMMRKRGMPSGTSWFSTSVLVTSVVDTYRRLALFERKIDPRAAFTLISEIAPRHPVVLRESLDRLPREELTPESVARAYGDRVEYDLHAARNVLAHSNGSPEVREELMRRMCELDANECVDLGWEMVDASKEDEAVAAFQRAFDEASSRVGVCNNANWLAIYYYEHGQTREAMAIADEVARIYCSWGLRTKAYLLERIGRVVQAEELYRDEAARYESDGPISYPLFGFYYRRARVHVDESYEARFRQLAAQVFPDGLEPLPTLEDDRPPTGGVLVDGNSGRLRRARLRGSDVIVGLDGWRVRSLEQYDAIRELRARTSLARDMRLRVWRQAQYLDVEADVPGRRFGVHMRTYGTPGPSFLYR